MLTLPSTPSAMLCAKSQNYPFLKTSEVRLFAGKGLRGHALDRFHRLNPPSGKALGVCSTGEEKCRSGKMTLKPR